MRRPFIPFLGVCVWLVLSLLSGVARGGALPPSVEAGVEASASKHQSAFTTGVIPTSLTSPIVPRLQAASPPVISCLGDSITNGYPYAGTENTYPAQLLTALQAAYGPVSYEVVNHGVNGYRADQVLADLQNLNWMAEDSPDFVLLMVGGNDLAQEANPFNVLDVIDQTVTEVQAIVDLVVAHTNPDGSAPRIIVSAFTPILDTSGSLALSLYNDSLESDLTGADVWFTENWDDFYDPATGQARPVLMSDVVHPNADGYSVMAENWLGVLQCLIADVDVDGDVDIDDISEVANRWRISCSSTMLGRASESADYDSLYDIDNDCHIDVVDIMWVAGQFGEDCE